jgi:threonine/homoserine efflux transporter RhtA
MTTINTNGPAELPSSQTLLRSTLIALAVAGTLLVTVVLPAESAIDPTGMGRVMLGLTQMGQMISAPDGAAHRFPRPSSSISCLASRATPSTMRARCNC